MKKKRSVNRILSVVLAIIMVFELLPAGLKVQAMSAGHGGGSEDDPVMVHNFAELKEALEAEEDLYIRVDEFENSEGQNYYELVPGRDYDEDLWGIIIPDGYKKYLELNTDIELKADSEDLAILIINSGELFIFGTGGIVYTGKSTDAGAVVIENDGDSLSIWGNVKIRGKNTEADGVCKAVSIFSGKTDIRGGSFSGVGRTGSDPAPAAVYVNGGETTISGGTFDSSKEGVRALSIGKNAKIKLSGGTFTGIEITPGKAGIDLAGCLAEGCKYPGSETGIGTRELDGEVGIVNPKIAALDLSVVLPCAGNTATDPVVTTQDLTLQSGSVKWERSEGGSYVPMGADETFIAGEGYRLGFSVVPSEGCGRTFPFPSICPVRIDNRDIPEADDGSSADCYKLHCDFIASPQYIGSTNVIVEVPKAGNAPADAVSTTDHTSVTKTEWSAWDDTNNNWAVMQPTDVFEAGLDYKASVTVAAEEGYRISAKPAGSFNTDTKGTIVSVSGGEYEYSAGFRVSGVMIDAINVDVAVPVAGAEPAAAVSTTEHVTVTDTKWFIKDDRALAAGETFEEGVVYAAEIDVETEPGFEIGNNPVLTVNSSTQAGLMNRSYTVLDMFAEFAAAAPATISEINVTLASPVAGAEREKAVATTEHVLVTDTLWNYFDEGGNEVLFPTDAVYEAGKTYVVYIFVQTDLGYPVSDTVKMLINGAQGAELVQKTGEYWAYFRAELQVTEKTLENIAITKGPDKTMYAPGESFDPAGMEVTAEFSDGSSSVVTGYSIKPSSGLQPGDKEVIISYTVGSVTKTARVEIQVIMIADNLSVSFTNGSSFVYTGSKITPEVEVKYNGKVLTEGVDYTVKYRNNIKASEGARKQPAVIVTGKTFAASGSKTFTITRKNIDDSDVIAEGLTIAKGKTAAPALYYGGKKLGKKDFSNPNAKTKFDADGNITIEGKGNYCGSRTIPVRVAEKKKISVTSFTPAERVYDHTAKPLTAAELTVKSGSTVLEPDKDYAISYQADITNAGKVKFTVVGIGEYSGSVSKSMTIKPCVTEIVISLPASVEFAPGGARPVVDVSVGAIKLYSGCDYTLKYSNNKSVTGAKKASVTLKFIGNYKGCAAVTKEFEITPYDLDAHGVKLYAEDTIYTKPGRYRKTPYVAVEGKLLSAKDMELAYSVDGKALGANDLIRDDMMQSGKVCINVCATGKGNYTGTINGAFFLSKADKTQDISKAKVSVEKKKYEFYGGPIVPTVTVKLGNETLVKDQDYTVSCMMNVNKGKGICIITGLGDAGTGPKKYYGTKVVRFRIVKGKLNWQ